MMTNMLSMSSADKGEFATGIMKIPDALRQRLDGLQDSQRNRMTALDIEKLPPQKSYAGLAEAPEIVEEPPTQEHVVQGTIETTPHPEVQSAGLLRRISTWVREKAHRVVTTVKQSLEPEPELLGQQMPKIRNAVRLAVRELFSLKGLAALGLATLAFQVGLPDFSQMEAPDMPNDAPATWDPRTWEGWRNSTTLEKWMIGTISCIFVTFIIFFVLGVIFFLVDNLFIKPIQRRQNKKK